MLLGTLCILAGAGLMLCEFALRPQGPPGPFTARTVLTVGGLTASVFGLLLLAVIVTIPVVGHLPP